MLSVFNPFGIFVFGILIGIIGVLVAAKFKVAAMREVLLVRQQRLSECESELRQAQAELLRKAQVHLDISNQLAATTTERDLLTARESHLQQVEVELKTANESKQLEVVEKSTALSAANVLTHTLQTQLTETDSRVSQLENEIHNSQNRVEELVKKNAELKTQLSSADEKLQVYEDVELRLSRTFEALASNALKSNNQEFLRLANDKFSEHKQSATDELENKKETISNLLETASKQLEQLQSQVHCFETSRQTGEAKLEQQITSLVDLQHRLGDETRRLSRALEKPNVRGSWGEIQLRRVVELAGMVEYCDFYEQMTIEDGDCRKRPDLIVRMPNRRLLGVDAKVSLDAFIKAANADSPEEGRILMQQHASQIRKHITDLSSKKYWSFLEKSPDLSVAFIPSEALYSAALQCDPSLLEFAASQQVLIATPTTLIALLRTVYYGWREEKLAASAQEISELGRVLYKRLITLQGHLSKLGHSIDSSIENYNKVVGSIESNAFPAARKFEQLGAATEEPLELLVPIEKRAKELQASDWQQASLMNPAIDEQALPVGSEVT